MLGCFVLEEEYFIDIDVVIVWYFCWKEVNSYVDVMEGWMGVGKVVMKGFGSKNFEDLISWIDIKS